VHDLKSVRELFVVRWLFRYEEGWNNGVTVHREIKQLRIEGNEMA